MAYTTVNEEQKKQNAASASPAAVAAASAASAVNGADTISPAKPVSAAASNTLQTSTPAPAATDYTDYKSLYSNAMSQLNAVKENLPTYDPSYDAALNDLFRQITDRKAFSYSPSDDMLYQQYKEQYTQQGQMAMRDTMGRAAALTGGYGSSYGQNAGQQAYHGYLQQLNHVLPELYGMAYQQYKDKGAALQNQYGMMQGLADDEYAKYTDRLNNYYRDLNYWQNQADTAYDRVQYADKVAYDREQDAYAKQQDAYNRLVDLIMNTGYTPDAEDLAAAGMKEGQMQAYLNAYAQAHSSGGGGGGRRKKEDNSKTYQEILNDAKREIMTGGNVEAVNSQAFKDANKSGLTVQEKQSLLEDLTNYAYVSKKLK